MQFRSVVAVKSNSFTYRQSLVRCLRISYVTVSIILINASPVIANNVELLNQYREIHTLAASPRGIPSGPFSDNDFTDQTGSWDEQAETSYTATVENLFGRGSVSYAPISSEAVQDSNITKSHFYGFGMSTASSSGGLAGLAVGANSEAMSKYEVEFEVPGGTAVKYTLNGTIEAFSSNYDIAVGLTEIVVDDNRYEILAGGFYDESGQIRFGRGGSNDIDSKGILKPGSHTFSVSAKSDSSSEVSSSSASFNFDFTMEAVPLPPGSIALPEAEPSDPPPSLEPDEPKRGLIAIAHGYRSEPGAWANDMAALMETSLQAAGIDGWDVEVIDWKDSANTILPSTAASRAKTIGHTEGTRYKNSEAYDKYHLIGHSAGSWLIDAFAETVNDSADVQLTLLDGYIPLGANPNDFRMHADYVEQYVDSREILDDFRGVGALGLPASLSIQVAQELASRTDVILPGGYNFDVTRLDPDFLGDLVTPLPIVEFIEDTHQWPRIFYDRTVVPGALGQEPTYEGTNADHGLGFYKSLSLGTPQYSGYDMGERIVLGDSAGEQIFDAYTTKLRSGAKKVLDGLIQFGSETGEFIQFKHSLLYKTGSPVWSSIEIPHDEKFNLIEFDFDFISEAGARGWLSVYLNDLLIFEADEFLTKGDGELAQIWLPEMYDPGSYWLSFRVDPFTDVQSQLQVENIRFGTVELITLIPEPTSLALFALSWLAMFRRRRLVRS